MNEDLFRQRQLRYRIIHSQSLIFIICSLRFLYAICSDLANLGLGLFIFQKPRGMDVTYYT